MNRRKNRWTSRTASRCLTLAAMLGALALAVSPRPAQAQRYVARADSLLRRGRVFAAETLYYYAVRQTPRDPGARLALGRYLAARGALRIGAVLMEEARFFGGDPKTVGTYLAPVDARLGDYKALSTLPAHRCRTRSVRGPSGWGAILRRSPAPTRRWWYCFQRTAARSA